jgi:peptidoglycan/LPS O-acetylase OafA/YrhL
MDTTANLHTSRLTHDESPPHEEGYLHYLAREGRWALRWCIGLCIIGIVVTMVSPIWFVAFIPAGVMFLSVVLLVIANAVEKRSDVQAHDELERSETATVDDVMEDHAEDDQVGPVTEHIVKRESKTGVVILCVALLAALLVAFFAIGQGVFLRIFPILALVVFAYMILLMAPVWLGWFNQDIESEEHRLHNLPEPEQGVTHEQG